MRTRRAARRPLFSPAERQALALPEALTVSAWADRCRLLDSRASAEPGPWRTSRVPYLREVMDSFCDPDVEHLTIMKAAQVGGTEAVLNMVGYAVDQDPGPLLIVLPREVDAAAVSNDRLRPMLEAVTLAGHLPASPQDLHHLELRLDRMTIYLAGANSPAALASRPCRYVFLDEVDKYPAFSGREADPVHLAAERTKTFWNRRIVEVSTPTTRAGYVIQSYEASDRRRYQVPCPKCGAWQAFAFPRLKWPEDVRDPEQIRRGALAWYECAAEGCGARWGDQARRAAVARGRWVPEGARVNPAGEIEDAPPASGHRGYHLPAFLSPWVTLSEIAAKFLESRPEVRRFMNFVNSWLAEPWEEKVEESRPEILSARAGDYPAGSVPAGALVLTAGVDVQKGCLYFVVRAWGYGEESWLVRAARVESWEELIRAMFRTSYPRHPPGGDPLPVRLACLDSGYRTDEVYEVVRAWLHVSRAVKGAEHLAGMPYRMSALDRDARTGRPMPSGLSLWHVDTSYYKDKLARLAAAPPDDPAAWHLHAEPAQEYLDQFCAERKITERNKKTGRTREVWTQGTSQAPNHYLDCEVYAAAAAEMLRVAALRRPGEEHQVFKPDPPRDRGGRGSWLGRNNSGGGWINREGRGRWLR